MKYSEEKLHNYSASLSDTEDQKCKNAIEMVSKALKDFGFTDNGEPIRKMVEDTYSYFTELKDNSGKKIKLFIQGSYANNTCVRTKSDVDIAAIQEDVFRPEYRGTSNPYPQTREDYGFSISSATLKEFKDEVQKQLIFTFGKDVERKNKSIKIHGNTYRKDVDTVPCMRYRDYRNDYRRDANNFIPGILICSDEGEEIINYPEQHIQNGKKKNVATNRLYKRMVRIIKNIRYDMIECGYIEAKEISSFGLESLLWNVPDNVFTKYKNYKYIFEDIILYLYDNQYKLSSYKEANGIKPLCESSSDTTKYSSFISALKSFYKYE